MTLTAFQSTKVRRTDEQHRLIRLYLNEIARYPLLTREEEQALGRRAQKGDLEALQRLVQGNMRFVVKIAKRYQGRGLSLVELISEGNLGLIEAARRFDAGRNVRFVTYAVWWIREWIFRALASCERPFSLPTRLNHFLIAVGRSHGPDGRSEPLDLPGLARKYRVSKKRLTQLLTSACPPVSLSQPLGDDSEQRLEDTIPHAAVVNMEQELASRSVNDTLHLLLGQLNQSEREILRLRFGMVDETPKSLAQIGIRLSLSRERVRQLQNRALRKLREGMKARAIA